VDIASAALVTDTPFAGSPWRHDKGGLWDVGPHALSVLWPALGDVTQVVASAGVRDQVHVALQHVGGASSTMSLTLTAPEAAIGSVAYVYGPAGRLGGPEVALATADVVRAHQRAIDALLVQAGRPDEGHPCDIHFGARVTRVLAAAERSLREGQVIRLE
jgi:predicted dehydrogenase